MKKVDQSLEDEENVEANEDLGLGDKVIQENRSRFVNKDGSFNVHRKGVLESGNFSPYHAILKASWVRFFIGVVLYYFIVNIIFTVLYLACGKAAFPDISAFNIAHRFGQLFFYSVQVISTLGSSPLHPATVMADAILAIEAMVGLFGFAVGASLLFARFSNPATKILFSSNALIAPYNGNKGFMFRIINGRSNELIQVSCTITLAMNEGGIRAFHQLPLERKQVLTFPVNWTIVHSIDQDSPLYRKTLEDLTKADAEFVVNITAVDPDLSKTVYVRKSYKDGEIMEGKFAYIIERDQSGTVVVDPKRISEVEKV
jgi:inward rectifier potassium channel